MLLLLLILLLVVFAVYGGLSITPLLFLVLIVALALLLVGDRGRW